MVQKSAARGESDLRAMVSAHAINGNGCHQEIQVKVSAETVQKAKSPMLLET